MSNTTTISVPVDAEKDRFWVSDTEIVAVYYNPQGNDENGLFEEHHFPYWFIMELVDKYPVDSEADAESFIYDLLYGDAIYCPTYCLDSGTSSFEYVVESWETGIRPDDTTAIGLYKWFVQLAKMSCEYNEYIC